MRRAASGAARSAVGHDASTHGPDAILDAARDTVLAVGVRRATLADVARRAQVSRMTVYRRFPDVAALLAALMTREFGGVIVEQESRVAALPTARERLVEAVGGGTEALAAHPLFLRILDVDPELLLPYVTARLGEVQTIVRATLEAHVRAGQADGSIRAGDPKLLAAAIELFARGPALGVRSHDPALDGGAAFAELRRMLDAYLAPEARA